MNENYGKLENGILTFAPSNLIIGDEQVFNATAEEYLSAGYLPIEYTPKPDNNEWQAVYTEVDGVILQSWVYEGRIHDHSNLPLLEDVTSKSLSGVPAVHILPADAKDGDMCLYAPQNTLTLADGGKRIYFDWEEFAKPLKTDEATEFRIVWWTSGLLFLFKAIRNETQNLITYSGLGTQFQVVFNNGLLKTESSYIESGYEEKKIYKDISELPLYFVVPEMATERERTENGNAYLFHTEYKLMKYQGGEWVEAVSSSSGNATVTVDGETLVIPASAFLANSLDEIEAMIDESGVLDE